MVPVALAIASGALGSFWFQRSLAGSIPGLILALSTYSSFSYPLGTFPVAVPWRALGFLFLSFFTGRLTGRPRQTLDLPFDLRIGFALIAGSMARGLFLLMWSLPKLRSMLQWAF